MYDFLTDDDLDYAAFADAEMRDFEVFDNSELLAADHIG